jgi:hypothetical protein
MVLALIAIAVGDELAIAHPTKTIDITGNLEVVHEVTNITMSGQHSGYSHIDLTITGGGPTTSRRSPAVARPATTGRPSAGRPPG